MEGLTVVHSGVKVRYSETRNEWTAEDESKEIQITRRSLQEIRKAIDAALRAKQEGRFKRFSAIKRGRSWGPGKYEIVTVTSVLEGGKECWISYEKRSDTERAQREKTYVSNLYEDSSVSREIIKDINDKKDQISVIEKEISDEEEKLLAADIK